MDGMGSQKASLRIRVGRHYTIAGEHTYSTFRSGANTTQLSVMFQTPFDFIALIYPGERRAFFFPSYPTVPFSSEVQWMFIHVGFFFFVI